MSKGSACRPYDLCTNETSTFGSCAQADSPIETMTSLASETPWENSPRAPIFIDDSAGLNVMQLRTKARRLKNEHGLGVIVVDYLQPMEGRGSKNSDNRVQEVSEISRGLKMIAKGLNIPVLALAQLSRAVRDDQARDPTSVAFARLGFHRTRCRRGHVHLSQVR